METTKLHTSVNIETRKEIGISPGDTVRVWQKIEEKGKTRLQAFEGVVLAVKHGNEPGGTFTVRRTTGGIGVERIFPLFSPLIDRIEVVRRTKVRRAKLYYIREKVAKEIRRQMRRARLVSEATLSEQEEERRVAQEADEAQKAEEAKKQAEAEAEAQAEAAKAEAENTEETQPNEEALSDAPKDEQKEGEIEEKK